MTEFSKNRSECQTCQQAFLGIYDNLSLIYNYNVSINFMPKSCNILRDSEFAINGTKN